MKVVNSVQNELEVALSSWIVQDGNYDNFEANQQAEFALEFYSKSFRKSDAITKSAKSLGAAKYEILGEVIYVASNVWVLDFGICAFQESKPPGGMEIGTFVAAEICLGIDPFFYFEYLHSMPGMPPLIYSWKINSIFQQTAPLIQSSERILIRDASKLGFKAIGKTDAWKDDDGNAEYVLNCTRLVIPAKKKITTTT
jgi:hypothetical protein